MKKINPLSFLIVCLFSACITPTANIYQAEKTPGVDYSKYKTYAWMATKDTSYTKLAGKKQVETALASAVIQQLSKRGMTLDTLNPDCLFTYTLVLNKTYTYGETPPPVYAPQSNPGALPGQYQMYYYVPASTAYYNPDLYQGSMKVNTFRDGDLVIDMVDKSDMKIIWRTSASGKVDERDRKGVKPTINEIVPIMFKKFPLKEKD